MYRIPLSEKIGDLADKHFVTLEEDTLVGVAARTMRGGGGYIGWRSSQDYAW